MSTTKNDQNTTEMRNELPQKDPRPAGVPETSTNPGRVKTGTPMDVGYGPDTK